MSGPMKEHSVAESEGVISVLTDTRCEGWVLRRDGEAGPIHLEVLLDGRHAMTASASEVEKERVRFRFNWSDEMLRPLEQKVLIRRQTDGALLAGGHAQLVSTRRPWLTWSPFDREWRVSISGSVFQLRSEDAMTLAAYLPLSLCAAGEREVGVSGSAFAREDEGGVEIRLAPMSGPGRLLRLDEPDLGGALRWRCGRGAGGMWIAERAELDADGLAGLAFSVLTPARVTEFSKRILKISCDGEPLLEESLDPGTTRKISVRLPSRGYHRLRVECSGRDPGKAFLLRGLALQDSRTGA